MIVGSGIAGLGCAYRLWARHGIPSRVFEYDTVRRRPDPDAAWVLRRWTARRGTRRVHQPRAHCDTAPGVLVSVSASTTPIIIRRAHIQTTRSTASAADRGPRPRSTKTGTTGDGSSSTTPRSSTAPWPQLYNRNNAGGRHFDRDVGDRVDRAPTCRAAFGRISEPSASRRCSTSSAALPTRSRPSTSSICWARTTARGDDVQPRGTPQLAGADEKWHIHGGNDQLISWPARAPAGRHGQPRSTAGRRSRPGKRLRVHLRRVTGPPTTSSRDHVVLAMPFTTLRLVDLSGVEISPPPSPGHRGRAARQQRQVLRAVRHPGLEPARPRHRESYCGGVVQGSWDTTNYQPGDSRDPGRPARGVTVGTDWGSRYGLDSYLGAPAAGHAG